MHMIAYHPDGSIQSKVNLCSCEQCIDVEFISCLVEKVWLFNMHRMQVKMIQQDLEVDIDKDDDQETEMYELWAESITSVISKGSTIALYTFSNLVELFYLCKVINFRTADETMVDEYNHAITAGSKFMKCQYYQKNKENKKGVPYVLPPGHVLVLPTQVLSPFVNLEDNVLSMGEYQWLCDSI